MDKSQLETMRHSCSHLLAAAVMELWPKTKLAIGPAIENGFYYDFDFEQPISEADLLKIEKKMAEIKAKNLPFVKKTISVGEAKKLFAGQQYKLELIDDLAISEGVNVSHLEGVKPKSRGVKPYHPRGVISLYATGNFTDLCIGPHVASTSDIGPFKLLSVAGAYWRGNEKNKMLTRIYGTCFPTQQQLDDYLKLLKEAEKRDHRKLGKELDLFSLNPLTGAGLILWHPKLAICRHVTEQFWKEEHLKNGYQLVYTPHIANMDMFVLSRHYIKYIDYMFPVMLHQYIEGESSSDYTSDEQLKPMNCPNHIQIYKSRPRSYRELPIKMAELGTVYRYERAGTLHGMTRVRGFTQDDSHIFCRPDQVIDEVKQILRLTKYFYETFGFKDYQAYLATRPEKYLGTKEMWNFAQESLKKALEE
ncbi:MAG: aminoacyl--tRNA ligase-related protein, partial [Microgenomates group bacterium]